MNIIPFRGLLPNLNIIPEQQHFFDTVKEQFRNYQEQNYFYPTAVPAFYVYRVQRAGLNATGLIGTTHIGDYLQGKILKHEKTIRKKEQIQVDLLSARGAAVKPALLVHRHEHSIREWLNKLANKRAPLQRVEFENGEQHLLWQVAEAAETRELQQLFNKQLDRAAIADGHHRFAAFARLFREQGDHPHNPFSALMTAYFPADELQIGAFHRLVELPDPSRQKWLLEKLAGLGALKKLESPALPSGKHQMCIATPGGWYRFDWAPSLLKKESAGKPLLDVDLLQQHILVPLLRVQNIRTDQRIHYIEGINRAGELEAALRPFPPGLCFLLHPIDPEDFLQVANAPGLTLVPKATFFQPRLKNGMIVHPLAS